MNTTRSATTVPHRASYLMLAGLILLSLGVGWAGSLVTTDQIPTWYATLDKPAWTPPDWLFAPVWTTLYVLIGIAGWRVAAARAPGHAAWRLWWVQLVLNAAWTPLFFGGHLVASALVVILLLLASIVWWIHTTWTTDRGSSLLFVPYLIWIAYASSLNAGIWWMN